MCVSGSTIEIKMTLFIPISSRTLAKNVNLKSIKNVTRSGILKRTIILIVLLRY